jgi:hypothetical protein
MDSARCSAVQRLGNPDKSAEKQPLTYALLGRDDSKRNVVDGKVRIGLGLDEGHYGLITVVVVVIGKGEDEEGRESEVVAGRAIYERILSTY